MYRVVDKMPKGMIAVVSVLFSLLACASVYGQAVPPDQLGGGKVTRTLGGNGDYWHLDIRIDQPRVNRHQTVYDRIHFQPGDRIQISAGGCVQTGGRGKTWKRYVDPSGPNSDRLYHGLISIAGVIGDDPPTREVAFANYHSSSASMRRIQDVIQHVYTLPPLNVLQDGSYNWSSTLVLGYDDDDYSDNGYDGHDDGTGDQCKGRGDAFIIIGITRKMPQNTQLVNGQVRCKFGVNAPVEKCGARMATDIFGLAWLVTLNGGYGTPFMCYDPVGHDIADLHIETFDENFVCRIHGSPNGPVSTTAVWQPESFPHKPGKIPPPL